MCSAEREHVWVVGLDDFHERRLRTIRDAEQYQFHSLLEPDRVVDPEGYSMKTLLRDAERQLAETGVPVDGVICHWDFPTPSIVALMGRRFGLRTPPLEATLRCEHKYWARLVQRDTAPELVPEFALVDPFAQGVERRMPLDPPFWLKPVKAFSSYLGFRIETERDWADAIRRTRAGIGLMAEPFEEVLEEAGPIDDLPAVDGHHCIAEAIIGGDQFTLEGYAMDGEVRVYGVVDSVRAANGSSFLRYDYPSHADDALRGRMIDATEGAMKAAGWDDGCFNIEFFHDPASGDLNILEINTRLSKSHCPLFELAEGASHHEPAVEIATGRIPDFPRGSGAHGRAAKFMLRRFEDGIVAHITEGEALEELEASLDGVHIRPAVRTGDRLSDLAAQDQDSYSHELGVIFVGGEDDAEIREKYLAALDGLDVRWEDGRGDATREAAPDPERGTQEAPE